MRKIAILTDIHANLPAFVAVLLDVQASGAERVVFLGDIVGYGASPAECVDWVRKLGGVCVMGNHDVEIRAVRKRGGSFRDPDWKNCGYQAGLAHAAECLDALEWLDETRVRIPPVLACVVTVGSVGQPRHGTEHRAAWVLWDSDEYVVDFRKTDYNRLQAAQDIATVGLPLESALRLLTDEEAAFLMG